MIFSCIGTVGTSAQKDDGAEDQYDSDQVEDSEGIADDQTDYCGYHRLNESDDRGLSSIHSLQSLCVEVIRKDG